MVRVVADTPGTGSNRARALFTAALGLGLALAALTPATTPRAQTPPLLVEHITLPRAPEVDVGDRVATVVRIDLSVYRLRMLTESHEGERRPLSAWVRDFDLGGGINAGMFLPSGRSCGFLMADGEVRSDRHPPADRWNALLGFDPVGSAAPLVIGGGCGPDVTALRASHRSVLQSRRLLIDCDGRPTRWRTNRFSAAALGRDEAGRAVMIHVRTPYRMNVLAEMLADGLGLRGLAYMEGGPEASLVVSEGDARVSEMGSWEDGFHPADDNHELWDLPNVVGFVRR